MNGKFVRERNWTLLSNPYIYSGGSHLTPDTAVSSISTDPTLRKLRGPVLTLGSYYIRTRFFLRGGTIVSGPGPGPSSPFPTSWCSPIKLGPWASIWQGPGLEGIQVVNRCIGVSFVL